MKNEEVLVFNFKHVTSGVIVMSLLPLRHLRLCLSESSVPETFGCIAGTTGLVAPSLSRLRAADPKAMKAHKKPQCRKFISLLLGPPKVFLRVSMNQICSAVWYSEANDEHMMVIEVDDGKAQQFS